MLLLQTAAKIPSWNQFETQKKTKARDDKVNLFFGFDSEQLFLSLCLHFNVFRKGFILIALDGSNFQIESNMKGAKETFLSNSSPRNRENVEMKFTRAERPKNYTNVFLAQSMRRVRRHSGKAHFSFLFFLSSSLVFNQLRSASFHEFHYFSFLFPFLFSFRLPPENGNSHQKRTKQKTRYECWGERKKIKTNFYHLHKNLNEVQMKNDFT